MTTYEMTDLKCNAKPVRYTIGLVGVGKRCVLRELA